MFSSLVLVLAVEVHWLFAWMHCGDLNYVDKDYSSEIDLLKETIN